MPGTPSAHSFPRRILLAVSGLSPQIVTETIYALATQATDAFVPTEVYVITTREGAKRAELSLLSKDLGWFHKLCKDYNLPPILFSRKHIHIVTGPDGAELDDIRSIADNHAAADFITRMVGEFTQDSQSALHVSIAGGRKTMGFYIGYALSLYGRAQDRLSHVLVSDPYESSIDFFYPTPYSRVLQTRDGKLADTALADVTLAEIPFVSLRHGLPQALLLGQSSFSDVVRAAQAAVDPPELLLDLQGRRIRAAGKIIDLPPSELALLAVFARQRIQGSGTLQAPPKSLRGGGENDKTDMEWAERYLREYRTITRRKADAVLVDDTARGRRILKMADEEIDATERTLKNGMDGEYFSSIKSKLTRRLKSALGPASSAYQIADGDKRPRRYSLTLPIGSVRFDSDFPST